MHQLEVKIIFIYNKDRIDESQEMNVCIPSKIHILKPNPQVMVFGEGPLRRDYGMRVESF